MSTADRNSSLEVLSKVPGTLRALVEERAKLASRLEMYEKRELAEEIVVEMDRKGLGDSDLSFRDKVASLLDSGKDLSLVKQAVEMAVPNMSFASLADGPPEGTDLVNYILGG